MTPTQMQQFLAILEAGSLGRAARALGVSEPALSKRLKDLENRLGVRLMERTSVGMTPTEAGRCVAHHAEVIGGEFKRLLESVASLKDGSAGRLSIGFSPSFGPGIVADAVGALYKTTQQVRIETYEGLAHDLVPLLLRGVIDLAVMTLDDRIPADEIAQIRLGTDPAFILARPGHPLAGRKAVRLEDLLPFRWLMARSGDRLRAWLEQRFAESGMSPPKPAIEFDSIAFARRMLIEHDLVAYLPSMVMGEDLTNRTLVQVAAPQLRWERTIGIAHRQAPQSPLAATMIQELKIASKRYRFA